eukprot:7189334-Prymnesium_polylepis.1
MRRKRAAVLVAVDGRLDRGEDAAHVAQARVEATKAVARDIGHVALEEADHRVAQEPLEDLELCVAGKVCDGHAVPPRAVG